MSIGTLNSHKQQTSQIELDAAEAERREIWESRFTSLDRRIMRETSNPNYPSFSSTGQAAHQVRGNTGTLEVIMEIEEMGDSENILRIKAHLRETACEMIRRGVYPHDGGWNALLGPLSESVRGRCSRAGTAEGAKERERLRDLDARNL